MPRTIPVAFDDVAALLTASTPPDHGGTSAPALLPTGPIAEAPAWVGGAAGPGSSGGSRDPVIAALLDPTGTGLKDGAAAYDPIFANAYDGEVSFISGVDATKKVVGTSFWTWNSNNPATYATTSKAHKFGSTAIGSAGGTVTYWFDTNSNWTTTERNALISGMGLWSAVANIQFAQAASAATASFTFIRGSDGSAYENNGIVASAIGSTTINNPTGAIISIDTSVAGFGPIGGSFDTYGGYPYQTLVHELGHLIGLGHGGAYNGNVNSATQQFSAYDTRLWTLMSYIDPFDTSAKYYNQYPVTGTSWGTSPTNGLYYYREPTTPMFLDILAAQQIYGAPTTSTLNNVTFGFNSTVPGLINQYFNFTVNQHPVVTLFATGASNTLDLSGWSNGATISLTPGTFTSANGMINNIGIGPSTILTKAIGTTGSDTFLPNPSYVTTMTGNGGNDTFKSTMFGLSLDTITDFAQGDKIILTDGASSTFTYRHTGTVLAYGNGATSYSMNLTAPLAGRLVKSADPSAGVDLTVTRIDQDDLNNDGLSNIVWRSSAGQLVSWDVSGAQITASQALTSNGTPVAPDASWTLAGTADDFGTGRASLIWRSNAGGLVNWTMNGAQVQASSPFTFQGVAVAPDASWSIAGFGDFNDDGKTDMLWRNSAGFLTEWQLNGTQITASQTITSQGTAVQLDPYWTVAGIGNFDGDPYSDLLMRNTSTGQLVEWLMNGSQIVSSSALTYQGTAIAPDLSWSVAGVGDFDGDHEADILWRGSDSTLALWKMDGSQVGSSSALTYQGGAIRPDASWSIQQVGDYNGDGKSDLLWRSTGNTLSEWIMNGSQIASTGLLTSNGTPVQPDGSWSIQSDPHNFV